MLTDVDGGEKGEREGCVRERGRGRLSVYDTNGYVSVHSFPIICVCAQLPDYERGNFRPRPPCPYRSVCVSPSVLPCSCALGSHTLSYPLFTHLHVFFSYFLSLSERVGTHIFCLARSLQYLLHSFVLSLSGRYGRGHQVCEWQTQASRSLCLLFKL